MTQIIILAGGKGTRMKQDMPKVLTPVSGKPIVKYLLDSVQRSGVCSHPCIVVGHKSSLVKRELGDKYYYALQSKQLGTGHAVMCALNNLKNIPQPKNVLVLYGDHAFLKPQTIKTLTQSHQKENSVVTLMTIKLPDFNGWRSVFAGFGRILRASDGSISKIIEVKEAEEEEKKITEVNPSYFCFDFKWLKKNIKKITNDNQKKEYYLTDLVGIAMGQGEKISSVIVDNPIEGVGVNSKEELAVAKQVIKEKGL